MPVITKTLSTLFRALQVLGTMYCTGVTTYFIVKIARHLHNTPDGKAIAIEVISGAAFLYASFMLMLAVCLLQKTFFQMLTIVGDLLFCGGFIAVAVLLRHAAGQRCGATNASPAPTFLENADGRASINCKLTKGLFGAAVGLAVLFFITALLALMAHVRTKKERSRGLESDYTSRHEKKSHKKSSRAAPTPVIAPPRHSVDTAYTKDTEKASDLDNSHIGRDYNQHNGTTSAMHTPAVVPVPRSVSPMPPTHRDDHEGSGNNYSNSGYANKSGSNRYREPTSAAGIDTLPRHQSPYNATNSNAAELGTSPNAGRGQRHNLDATSPSVGGVTGQVYNELHVEDRHHPRAL